MNPIQSPDELLVVVLLLALATYGLFYLVDLWNGSSVRAVWRTVRADWQRKHRQRFNSRALRGSRSDVLCRLRLIKGGR